MMNILVLARNLISACFRGAMLNTDKNQLGEERIHLSYISISQTIIHGHQAKKTNRNLTA